MKFLVTAGRTEKEIKTSVINWQPENDQKETVKQLRTERLDICIEVRINGSKERYDKSIN